MTGSTLTNQDSFGKMEKRETLTVLEAARRLGIGRDTAYNGVREGSIPSIRVGHRIIIPKAALERLLAEGQFSGNEAA